MPNKSLSHKDVLAPSSQYSLPSKYIRQVMPPLEGKTGKPAVLLFGQGASIPTEMYAPLGLALQEAAPFPLWFASPQCLSNGACLFFSHALSLIHIATLALTYRAATRI